MVKHRRSRCLIHVSLGNREGLSQGDLENESGAESGKERKEVGGDVTHTLEKQVTMFRDKRKKRPKRGAGQLRMWRERKG